MENADFWAGKSIFLTGGTGFFGKSILDMLLQGALPQTRWTILSRDPAGFLAQYPEFSELKQIRFQQGDVKDFPFPQQSFDLILHAATPAVTDLLPGAMREVILRGMARVLQFAEHCGAQKILFPSSGAVYGAMPQEISAWRETDPCNPVTEYGIAKLEAENMCISSGIPTVIARCFAFAGVRLNPAIHFAFGNFIRNAVRREPIVIKGDGTPLRTYLYADDLVEWLFALLEKGKSGRVYNVGSPHAVSIAELAQTIAGLAEFPLPVEIQQTHRPGDPVDRYVPDVTRIQQELGVQMKISLAEAIQRTASAWQKSGNL